MSQDKSEIYLTKFHDFESQNYKLIENSNELITIPEIPRNKTLIFKNKLPVFSSLKFSD